mmetsp:Transcript_14084/g.29848  ORF Transcript_14084/g.29848 Transcript_14084/m.29848 type:complete len:362 (-) Transcript_14084:390-1475(-)
MRIMILIHITRIPPLLPILILKLHILDPNLLLPILPTAATAPLAGSGRGLSGLSRRRGFRSSTGVAAFFVVEAPGSGSARAAGGGAGAGVGACFVGAVGAYVVEYLPTSQSFLLRQPRPRMGMAIPLVIERQRRIPTRLRPALPARIALRAPRTPPRTRTPPRSPARETRRIVEIVVVRIDALGAVPQLLPPPQEFLLGDLHVRVSRATPVFVVPDSRSDGGGARRDGATRRGRSPGGATPSAGHGGIVSSSSFARLFVVPRLDALGTRRHENLPPAAHFLRRHLHLRMVVATALLVEGGGEFLVHVAAATGGILGELVGRAVELGFALFDFAGAAEGGDAAGFVEFGGAFGAVHLQLHPH